MEGTVDSGYQAHIVIWHTWLIRRMLSSRQILSRPSIRSTLLQLNEKLEWVRRNIPQVAKLEQARKGSANEDHFANNQWESLLQITNQKS